MRWLFVLAALLFALPAHAVTMEWVEIGDPGNAADTEVMTCCEYRRGMSGFGSVGYTYRISTYEVTNAQYAEFLNAVAATDANELYNQKLYSTSMGSGYGGITRSGSSGSYTYSTIAGRENMPVNYVNFYDALRFANWLHNGQPSGAQDNTTTEDGAYTMIGEDYGAGQVISRNPGATIFLPRENEWYKAAYYDPVSEIYFDFPTGTDVPTTCAAPGATANTVNCGRVVGDLTIVGSYTNSASPSGTFDQAGNVTEWNETIVLTGLPWGMGWRGLRGGGFYYNGDSPAAYNGGGHRSGEEGYYRGFRVASVPTGWVPDCGDGIDTDNDGLADMADPGCLSEEDSSEREFGLVCDDGLTNDWEDPRIDFDPLTFANPGDQYTLPAGLGDPGCYSPTWVSENPGCQDGIDNDGDGKFDYDGGLAALGYTRGEPDPYCAGTPWVIFEAPPTCGLGVELALVLAPLMWMWRRRRA